MSSKNKRLIDHKRGNLFSFNMNLVDDGESVIIEPENIRCQLRNPNGELISTCVVTADGEGGYTLKVVNTNDWPLSMLEFDVAITIDEETIISDIYEFQVIKNITLPE